MKVRGRLICMLLVFVLLVTFTSCAGKSVAEMKGEGDTNGLIKALDSYDSETRVEAAKALGAMGVDNTLEPLISCLDDYDRDVRRAAIATLGEIGDIRAIDSLVHSLEDDDQSVRTEAANSLDKLGWNPENDTETAYYLIARESWDELLEMGESAIEPLIRYLEYDDITEYVVVSLIEIGEPAIASLIQVLKSADYGVRSAASEVLSQIEGPVIEPLFQSLKEDEDWYDRSSGLELLLKLGWEARSLTTGTYLVRSSSRGDGELTIKNGLEWDALMALTRVNSADDKAFISVYIKAGDSYTIKGIPEDTYILYYTFGSDWDDNERMFSIVAERSVFEDTFEFEITKNFWGDTQYTVWEVTLYPVTGGNADTTEVKEEDFPEV